MLKTRLRVPSSKSAKYGKIFLACPSFAIRKNQPCACYTGDSGRGSSDSAHELRIQVGADLRFGPTRRLRYDKVPLQRCWAPTRFYRQHSFAGRGTILLLNMALKFTCFSFARDGIISLGSASLSAILSIKQPYESSGEYA